MFRSNEAVQMENTDEEVGQGIVDPRALSPLNRSRNRKAESKKKTTAVAEVAVVKV